jgi:hypothetical protein
MQMNVYVPQDRKYVLDALERAAALSGKSKSEIVLEALERYLPSASPLPLGRFDLGAVSGAGRVELYAERLCKA